MEYCRLCAKTDKKPLVSILESSPLKIKEKLLKLLHIQVVAASKLPSKICLDCLTKLNHFNEFFTTAKENQEILKILLVENERIVEESTPDDEPTPQDGPHEIISQNQVLSLHENTTQHESVDEDRKDHRLLADQLVKYSQDESLRRKRKFDRFDCYVCKEQFPSNLKFIQHFRDNHPFDEIRYSCFICSTYVKKYRSYTRHLESHIERRFACDICDKSFSQKITLVQHLNCHSNLKSYSCEECGLNFKQNSSLFKHRKQKHSNEMPCCSECKKLFVNNETLLQHMKSKHNLQKDIVCSECSKTFASRSALIYHRKSQHQKNIDSKSTTCNICNKKFKTLIILSRHNKHFH